MSILRLMLLAMLTLTVYVGSAAAAAQVAPPPTPTTPAPPTTTQPADELSTPAAMIVALLLLTPALVGAAVAGVFRRGSIRGPHRLGPGSRIIPVLLVFLIGAACWFG